MDTELGGTNFVNHFSSSECDQSEHTCDNSYCLPAENVCDGMEDCFDKSDEMNCGKICDISFALNFILEFQISTLLSVTIVFT